MEKTWWCFDSFGSVMERGEVGVVRWNPRLLNVTRGREGDDRLQTGCVCGDGQELLGGGGGATVTLLPLRQTPSTNTELLGHHVFSSFQVHRKPSLSLYKPLYDCRYWRSELPNFSTPHQGKGGYWWSPQRYQDVGTTWRDTHRHQVVLPGNTGFSDVPSSLTAGYCRRRPALV
uniref:Uncharacterized protein n=1 Tax=Knipowitschia caucasica TaxID=637954 RepID=A0AAV2JBJ0_KNICA